VVGGATAAWTQTRKDISPQPTAHRLPREGSAMGAIGATRVVFFKKLVKRAVAALGFNMQGATG